MHGFLMLFLPVNRPPHRWTNNKHTLWYVLLRSFFGVFFDILGNGNGQDEESFRWNTPGYSIDGTSIIPNGTPKQFEASDEVTKLDFHGHALVGGLYLTEILFCFKEQHAAILCLQKKNEALPKWTPTIPWLIFFFCFLFWRSPKNGCRHFFSQHLLRRSVSRMLLTGPRGWRRRNQK